MPPAKDTPLPPLQISVVNGNLKFVEHPLVLGHYRALALTGTEHVMDPLIGGNMTEALKMGNYPERAESQQVFVNCSANKYNPLQLPRPEAVIVVGLGDEGNLRPADLARTVRRGVIAWAQRLAERSILPSTFELAATLIGSGGTGISAGQSACFVAQGVIDARRRLTSSKWPLVDHLYLIELYLDRATEAWLALRAQEAANPDDFVVGDVVFSGTGGLRRPLDVGYRGAGYDLITAMTVNGEHGTEISYTMDTKRARTEVRAQATQLAVIQDRVAAASSDLNPDAGVGRTLFQLVVPPELEPFLDGTSQALIVVDSGTAGIPWEMLDTTADGDNGGVTQPWAIRSKLLRKLRTKDFRPQVQHSTVEDSVLVIGEPATDEDYERLPGAREEAQAIVELLDRHTAQIDPANVKSLFSRDPKKKGASAATIINTLFSRGWRVIHIAGHGESPDGEPRGVVLSDGQYFGPPEIGNLRVVPDLVFVNCCYLAARDPGELLRADDGGSYDRARFAATVAEALIRIGVRCVIAAGWPVDDDVAKTFAATLYSELLGGSRFMDAVAEAREASQRHGGNTWAAYQCYGDPDWTFSRRDTGTAAPIAKPEEMFASVASPDALRLALETMTINGAFDEEESRATPARLVFLEKRFGKRWGARGDVADSFGAAWAAHDRAKAIRWYARALAANDGRASVRAAEQLGSLRVQWTWKALEKELRQPDGDANAANRRRMLNRARKRITDALRLLERLVEIQPTIERESLCGSAYKRLAQVEAAAGRLEAEATAIARMRDRYASAEAHARQHGDPELFYPAMNSLAAELIVDAAAQDWKGFDAVRVKDVRERLEAKTHAEPDFWSVAGLTELRVYEAVARGDVAAAYESVELGFADLRNRVVDRSKWESVRDQQQYVLSKYRTRASEAEQAACEKLMSYLDALAQPDGA